MGQKQMTQVEHLNTRTDDETLLHKQSKIHNQGGSNTGWRT